AGAADAEPHPAANYGAGAHPHAQGTAQAAGYSRHLLASLRCLPRDGLSALHARQISAAGDDVRMGYRLDALLQPAPGPDGGCTRLLRYPVYLSKPEPDQRRSYAARDQPIRFSDRPPLPADAAPPVR